MAYENLGLDPYLNPINKPIDNGKSQTPLESNNYIERGGLNGNQVLSETLTNAEVRNAYRAYNVVVSGITGDGDTTDIQTAIDSLNNLGTGGVILIRPGTYLPEAPITLYSNISLVGVDPVNTIVDFENAGDCGLGCFKLIGTSVTDDGTITATNDSATISGSSTQFSTDGVTAGDTIIIRGGAYVVSSITNDTTLTLTELYKGRTQAGLSYDIWRGMQNAVIENLTIKDGADASTPGAGIEIQNADNIDVNNCIIENCADGIGVGVQSGLGTFNVKVKNNTCRHNTDNGIEISRTYAGYFTDNVCVSNGGNGIESGFSVTGINVYITDCVCNSNDNYGLHLNVAGYHIIKGSSFNSNVTHGVYLEGASKNVFIGNTADANGTDGFHLTNKISVDSENNVLLGNLATNNGDDGIELTAGGTNSNVCHNVAQGNGGTGIVNGGTGNTVLDNT